MKESDILKSFEGLSPKALESLKEALEIASQERTDLSTATLVREIVPIEKWLNSPYYLGGMSESLYDFWKEEIKEFVTGKYTEWAISGAIGIGKSTAALVAIIRKIYELSCYDVPQRLFRLSDVTKIFFMYFSINEKQAELTGFGQLRDTLDAIPYFQENFPRDPSIDSVLKFPSKLIFLCGSDVSHVAGTNLLCSILDEANFYKSGSTGVQGNLDKAMKMYSEVSDRRKSRFLYGGVDPGFSLLVSSTTTEGSFIQMRIKNAKDTIKVTEATPWKVKPKGTFSQVFFPVFKGSQKVDPFVIDTVDDLKRMASTDEELEWINGATVKGKDSLKDSIDSLPTILKQNVIYVPEDFKQNFQSHIITALQNLAGVATSPSGKLFSNRLSWEKCVVKSLQHPFTKEALIISTDKHGEIQDFFLKDRFFEEKDGYFQPKRHPGEKRYLHIDQSTSTDCTGVAMVHRGGSFIDESTGLVQPIVEVDFVLRIIPPVKPDKISLSKIRRFIFWLRSNGVKFGFVSYDQHQSTDSLQTIQSYHIPCGTVSTDRDDKVWTGFCSLIYEERLHLYRYPPLEKEFFSLDHNHVTHKVDHPALNLDGSPGSKDVADALVAAVSKCLEGVFDAPASTKDLIEAIDITHALEKEEIDLTWTLFPRTIHLTQKAIDNLDLDFEFLGEQPDRMKKDFNF